MRPDLVPGASSPTISFPITSGLSHSRVMISHPDTCARPFTARGARAASRACRVLSEDRGGVHPDCDDLNR